MENKIYLLKKKFNIDCKIVPVSEFEDYVITEKGEVYKTSTMKIVTPKDYNGDPSIYFLNRLEKNRRILSSLMGQAFLTRKSEDDVIYHIDGNKKNYNIENLIYVSSHTRYCLQKGKSKYDPETKKIVRI